MSAKNPFYTGTYHGHDCFTMDAASRLDRVKNFTLPECRAALRVDGLQKAVRQAIERRIKKFEKESTS